MRKPPTKQLKHLINDKITSTEVRLVGDNITPGIYKLSEARKICYDLGVDLVMLSDKGDIPVCRATDYSKFIYDLEKNSKIQKSPPLKEIKLSPNIGDHDIEFKSKHAIKFLEDGSKIKVTMEFRGRQITHKENGEVVLLKFSQLLESYGVPESLPKLEGKKMLLFIKPIKKNG